MQILYGFSNCTDKTYNRIISERNNAALMPDQKYHGLMIKGLAENGAQVKCISGLPVNRAVTARKLVREPDEQEGNAHYHYITTLNFPVLRQLMILFGTLFSVLKTKKTADTYAIYDCLNLANAYGMALGCRLKKIPAVTIVTDLPDMERQSGTAKNVNNRLFNKADGFILLTEQMNGRVNHRGMPHIVLEGHVDSHAPAPEEVPTYEETEGLKTILYAGSLKKIYGIRALTEGFIQAAVPGSRLHIYGEGDFRKELEELCKNYDNVCYLGVKKNSEIVAEEQKASLLVNPRPSAPEYTKYSFPSKNMEYMVSGTPLLTTHLPGMPDEYIPYVSLIEEENAEGIAKALKLFFSASFGERREKGRAAREFVLKNKSNTVQAKKILDFLSAQVK